MDYRKLGNSGAIVTAYCLGTMTFGAEADEAASHALLDDYFAWGGNFIDTADVYSNGISEQIVGRWLKAHPSEAKTAVVATKGRFPVTDGPNNIGLSRRHLNAALNDSLKRLGIEQIDLYQMHAWDALTPLEETLRFLDDAVSAGKIGYYGFSNFLGWHITKAVHLAKANHWAAPITLQPQYNLLVREIESEVVPAWGRKPPNESSAYTRASIAWPSRETSLCAKGRASPAATSSCSSTRSTGSPCTRTTDSVTGCSTWRRVFISRK